MAEPGEEKLQAVPDWAAKILQAAIRDYRYTGDYLPGTDTDKVVVGLRRGDRAIGTVTLTHAVHGDKHSVRLVFEAKDRSVKNEYAAPSLKLFQAYATLLLERACAYGCSLDRAWCEQCSQAARHSIGQFRGGATPKPGSPTAVPP